MHFGLGKAAKADRVEVLWPSGLVESFADVKAGETAVLKEGTGDAR
jgi:hypothetical protein